jgi:hypothetical protein
VAGARWATEVLRVSRGLCVRILWEEGALFHFSVRSRSEPGSFISFFKPSRTLRHILRRQASLPRTREFASFPHSRVHSCFRHGLLPGPPGSCHPPKWSAAFPRNPPRRSTNSTLPFCAPVDFVQDSLYPNELRVYKPASKVVPRSPRLQPSSTLKSSFTTRLSVQVTNDHVSTVKEFSALVPPRASPPHRLRFGTRPARHD